MRQAEDAADDASPKADELDGDMADIELQRREAEADEDVAGMDDADDEEGADEGADDGEAHLKHTPEIVEEENQSTNCTTRTSALHTACSHSTHHLLPSPVCAAAVRAPPRACVCVCVSQDDWSGWP